MNKQITALYTNLYDANNAMNCLRTNGITMAQLNISEFGLHIGINKRNIIKKFPGAILSTIVKLEINVDSANSPSVISVIEGSFGVID